MDHPPLVLPPEGLRYVLWQREAYRHPLLRWLVRKKLVDRQVYLKHLAGSWLERRRRPAVARALAREMDTVFDAMAPALPATIGRSLDIGCGLAAIDARIAAHYAAAAPEIWLLDKDDDSPMRGAHYTAFHAEPAAYNSLATSVAFLKANGVPAERIRCVDIARAPFPEADFDLVVSLLSWGFHFPVSYYLDEVAAALRPDGRLFLDVRKGTDGLAVLRRRFAEVRVLLDAAKHDFVVATGVRA